jgi:hypothetical protein
MKIKSLFPFLGSSNIFLNGSVELGSPGKCCAHDGVLPCTMQVSEIFQGSIRTFVNAARILLPD